MAENESGHEHDEMKKRGVTTRTTRTTRRVPAQGGGRSAQTQYSRVAAERACDSRERNQAGRSRLSVAVVIEWGVGFRSSGQILVCLCTRRAVSGD